jgi:lysophospholipase L1-like esterase
MSTTIPGFDFAGTVGKRSLCAQAATFRTDWVERLPDVLAAESSDVVLFYCGSNDLNRDVPHEDIVANVSRYRRSVHERSLTIRFAYFGIIKAPQKGGKRELIDRLNERISAGLPAGGDLYVESNAVLFRDGSPVSRYFVEDGLHLTDEAYDRLTEYSAPLLEGWLHGSP